MRRKMPSLFRAKLLGQTAEAKGFVYQVPEMLQPSNGTAPDHLPAGTELLWNKNSPPEAQPEPEYVLTEADVKAREQQAWQNGFQAASMQARENLEKALAVERAGLVTALSEFAQARGVYYERIEGEVVRLVLSIARKVLHRESQVDPMLLTGIVRVALEGIAGGTTVQLRVPASQAESWRAEVRSLSRRDLAIEVIADESLSVPSCSIATEMGSTEVSLEAQLGEIERGFLDLLAERPASL
jgi:flagellar assembly protein FliH